MSCQPEPLHFFFGANEHVHCRNANGMSFFLPLEPICGRPEAAPVRPQMTTPALVECRA